MQLTSRLQMGQTSIGGLEVLKISKRLVSKAMSNQNHYFILLYKYGIKGKNIFDHDLFLYK